MVYLKEIKFEDQGDGYHSVVLTFSDGSQAWPETEVDYLGACITTYDENGKQLSEVIIDRNGERDED